jgi:hypothetical protein
MIVMRVYVAWNLFGVFTVPSIVLIYLYSRIVKTLLASVRDSKELRSGR